ncbi:MAG: hypothetical protein ACKOB3_03110 [Holophagaceae bacterium]
MRNINVILTAPILALSLACNAPTAAAVLDSGGKQTQVQLRSMQSRVFDTTDREKTLRTVIATLQDLSFVIDKADLELGTISATKLSGYNLRITVSVRPRGTTQLSVRANASFNDEPILDPKPYQDFFVSLEKAMFLTAQQVD